MEYDEKAQLAKSWRETLERIGRDEEWIRTIERCANSEGGSNANNAKNQLVAR